MARLNFPDNREVIDRAGNWFGAMWLRWFDGVQRRIGGIDDVTSITTADIAAAGAAYNQAYIQTIADLVNELKAKQNETLTTLRK